MLKQTFLLGALVIFSLPLGCVSTYPLELGEIDSRVRSLEKELQAEREKVKQLTAELQALRLPITGQSVTVTELVAVPEEYLGKDILLEVQLTHLPSIGEYVSYFMVRDLNNNNYGLHCYFKTQELDPDSRRLLVSKQLGQRMKISGRLTRAVASTAGEKRPGVGLSSQVEVRPSSGYEFHVSRVIN